MKKYKDYQYKMPKININTDMSKKIWGKTKPKKKLIPIYNPKKINMMKDTDGDGYPDIIDCDKNDPKKDGLISKTLSFIKGKGFKDIQQPQTQPSTEFVGPPEPPKPQSAVEQPKEFVGPPEPPKKQPSVDKFINTPEPPRNKQKEGLVSYPPSDYRSDKFVGPREQTKEQQKGVLPKEIRPSSLPFKNKEERELIKRLEQGDYDKSDPENVKQAENLKKFYNIKGDLDVERVADLKTEAKQTARDIAIMAVSGKIGGPISSKFSSLTGKLVTGLGEDYLVASGLNKISEYTGSKESKEAVKDLTFSTTDGKTYTGKDALNVLMNNANFDVEQKMDEGNKIKKYAYDTLPYIFKHDTKDTYVNSISENLDKLGITDKNKRKTIIDEALRRRSESLAIQTSGLVRAEQRGNILGSQAVNKKLKDLGISSFEKLPGAKRIFYGATTRLVGGMGEGGSSYLTYVGSTGQEVKATDLGKSMAYGAAFAGGFGSGEELIKPLSVGKYKIGQSISNVAGTALDPGEPIGDVFGPSLFPTGKTKIKTIGVSDVGIKQEINKDVVSTKQKVDEFFKSQTNNKINTKIDNKIDTKSDIKISGSSYINERPIKPIPGPTTPTYINQQDENKDDDKDDDKDDENEEEKNLSKDDMLNKENLKQFVITPKRMVPFLGLPGGSMGGIGRGFKSELTGLKKYKLYDITKSFKSEIGLGTMRKGGAAGDLFEKNRYIRPTRRVQTNPFLDTVKQNTQSNVPNNNVRMATSYINKQPTKFQKAQGYVNKGFKPLMTKAQKKKQLFGDKKKKWI